MSNYSYQVPTNLTLPAPSHHDLSLWAKQLIQRLTEVIRIYGVQINGLATTRITSFATRTAAEGAPTTGQWQNGDKVWRSNVTEQGTAGSKFVHIGWICVTSGTPGTWVQMRTLTGN